MAVNAQAIIDRIRQQIGAQWKETSVDAFLAGDPETTVTGIATSYAPSLEVLEKAVAAGKNLLISRESPYWARDAAQIRRGTGGFGVDTRPPSSGRAPLGPEAMDDDPVYRKKRDYIDENKLVIYRFFENWSSRYPDPQLQGLAKVLGWENYYRPSGGRPWAAGNGFFEIPPATLLDTARNIKQTLNMKSIRVAGDPGITVRKVGLSHGMYWLPELQAMMAEPDVDLMIMGEPQWENEVCLYNFDLHAAGVRKGLILLGQQVSEEPGCGEMADWLSSFIDELPVQWIPAGEPAWMPY